jgi:hypothetical protein
MPGKKEPPVGGSDNSFSSYFNEVLIEVNLLFRLVPSALETGGQRMWGDLLVASGMMLPALVYGAVLFVNYLQ